MTPHQNDSLQLNKNKPITRIVSFFQNLKNNIMLLQILFVFLLNRLAVDCLFFNNLTNFSLIYQGLSSSVTSFCQISPNLNIATTENNVLWSIKMTSYEHTPEVSVIKVFAFKIIELQCTNNGKTAYALASNLGMILKFEYLIGNNQFEISNFTLDNNEKPCCFNFYNFPSQFNILYILTFNSKNLVVDFSASSSPVVLRPLTQLFAKTIVKCYLTKNSFEYANFLLTVSYNSDLYCEDMFYISNGNQTSMLTDKFSESPPSAIAGVPYEFIAFDSKLKYFRHIAIQNTGSFTIGYTFNFNEIFINLHPPLLSTWFYNTTSYLFILNNEKVLWNSNFKWDPSNFRSNQLLPSEQEQTFFRILEGNPGIIQIGTNKGQFFFLSVSLNEINGSNTSNTSASVNNQTTINNNSNITQKCDCPSCPQDDNSEVVVVGSVLGSLLGISLICLIVLCLRKHQEKSHPRVPKENAEMHVIQGVKSYDAKNQLGI